MSIGGATAEAAGGAVKKGFKWAAIGTAISAVVAGGLAVGLLAAFAPAIGIAAIIGIGALMTIGGGVLGFSLFGALLGGIGAVKGAAQGAGEHAKREGNNLSEQLAMTRAQNAAMSQQLQQDAMLNPNAPQDGRWAAQVNSERQGRSNVPPVQIS